MQYNGDNPRCYTENTSKEELVLEHVLEYNRQFKIIYQPLRELLLAPKNECGKRKFICTTIRPTKLPFVELYEWESCAKFVADFLEYEELAHPDKLPERIPSPANVLNWQLGDSFDFAILLCSLLIGVGFDAYVVYGTAPKKITTRDESLENVPFSTVFEDKLEDEDPLYDKDAELMQLTTKTEDNPNLDFKVKISDPHRSAFDDAQKDEEETKQREAELKAVTIDDDEPDYEKEDEYDRCRLHAWVYVQKTSRQVPEPFFIEPTTGRRYAVDESPYYTVEAIFNHTNFWINLDPSRDLSTLSLDFTEDSELWEFVMIQTKKKSGSNQDGEDESEHDEENEDEAQEEILDMPPPWSPKLIVDKSKFNERCPNGEKTMFFKKTKVDFYSECKQVDGLVKRTTIYKDYNRLIVDEVRSEYACRVDKLKVRRRFPY